MTWRGDCPVAGATFTTSAVYADRFARFHLIFGSAHRLPKITTMVSAALGAVEILHCTNSIAMAATITMPATISE